MATAAPTSMLTLEQALVLKMLAERGHGEIGGNNDGPHVWRYRRWIDDDAPWCTALVCYAYEEAAGLIQRPLPRGFRRTHSSKALGKIIIAVGREIRIPEPGCIYVFNRGRNPLHGHIGVCERYEERTDTMHGIEGNKGPPPSPVAQYEYRNGLWRRDLAILATTRKPVSMRRVA